MKKIRIGYSPPNDNHDNFDIFLRAFRLCVLNTFIVLLYVFYTVSFYIICHFIL